MSFVINLIHVLKLMIFKLPLKFQLKTNVNLLSPTWTLSVSRIPITYGFWSAISCKVTEKKLHCYEIYFMLTYRKYQKMHLLITCDCICHNFCTIFYTIHSLHLQAVRRLINFMLCLFSESFYFVFSL